MPAYPATSTYPDSETSATGEGNADSFRQRMTRGYDAAREKAVSSHPGMSEKHQKALQNKLNRLQKGAPGLTKKLAQGKPSALASALMHLLSQIDLTKDWLFIPVLVSFALLKDIFDIAFAAIPGVGIVVSFVAELMLVILTVTVLLLTSSDLKNRGLAKYFIGLAVAFISEALPGISWLPLAAIEVLILYLFVLFDRALEAREQKGTAA